MRIETIKRTACVVAFGISACFAEIASCAQTPSSTNETERIAAEIAGWLEPHRGRIGMAVKRKQMSGMDAVRVLRAPAKGDEMATHGVGDRQALVVFGGRGVRRAWRRPGRWRREAIMGTWQCTR